MQRKLIFQGFAKLVIVIDEKYASGRAHGWMLSSDVLGYKSSIVPERETAPDKSEAMLTHRPFAGCSGRGRTPRRRSLLRVQALSAAATQGVVALGLLRLRCALGRSGRRAMKREGDGATPVGLFTLCEVMYRPDRGHRPRTGLPVSAVRSWDGWCDDARDSNYNRKVRLPYVASAETLWRDDHAYDVIVVLDHNRRPRVKGRGSAIFMHVAQPGYAPTAGCIALSLGDLRRLIGLHRRTTAVYVPR
jgi:L,D-peptidoglycan transpeptidase YkuD (ErfK/YbiS/YcfS/YnhG family)